MQREDKWKEFYRKKYPEIWKKRVIHYGFTEYHKHILALLDTQKGEQILECGIGTGVPLAISLANKGFKVTGVDISQDLLGLCQLNFEKESLTVKCCRIDMDTENLPFEDRSFDKVYSISTTWYLLDIKKVLSEMVRVTKSGGRIVFDILNILHVSSLCTWVYGFLRNSSIIERIKPSHMLHKYRSPFYISGILKNLGVEYIVKGYYLFLPVCLPIMDPIIRTIC